MRDGRSAGAALRADEGDAAAERLSFRINEDRGHRRKDIGHGDGLDHIFGNAVADEFAIEPNIVVIADNDDLGRRIADGGERRELAEQVRGIRLGLEDDEVRRRGAGKHIGGSGDAAAGDAHADFRDAPIIGAAFHDMLQGLALAEGVDGDARQRPHVFQIRHAHRLLGVAKLAGVFNFVFDRAHRPVPPQKLLSLPTSSIVDVVVRYSWMALLRRCASIGVMPRGATRSSGLAIWAARLFCEAQPKL